MVSTPALAVHAGLTVREPHGRLHSFPASQPVHPLKRPALWLRLYSLLNKCKVELLVLRIGGGELHPDLVSQGILLLA